jgi:hypothetical protein
MNKFAPGRPISVQGRAVLLEANMTRFLSFIIIVLFFLPGCASSLEEVNKGAEEAGKPAGKVMRVPSSAGKGAAEGVAGEPESNPYKR